MCTVLCHLRVSSCMVFHPWSWRGGEDTLWFPFCKTGRWEAQWLGNRTGAGGWWLVSGSTTPATQGFWLLDLCSFVRKQTGGGMLTRRAPLTRHWSSLYLMLSSAEGRTKMPTSRGTGEESAGWGETGRKGCLRLGSASHLSTKEIEWEDPTGSYKKQMRSPSLLLLSFSPTVTPGNGFSSLRLTLPLCFLLALLPQAFYDSRDTGYRMINSALTCHLGSGPDREEPEFLVALIHLRGTKPIWPSVGQGSGRGAMGICAKGPTSV